MSPLDNKLVCDYVNENISDFHDRKIRSLSDLRLDKLLSKNPYLFRAKNINSAEQLIHGLLDAYLSSSEEKLFGDFLEGLAIYVAESTCGGHKSSASGLDLEFLQKGVHYIVSVKSGTNWGNSSQQNRLEHDFKQAVTRLKQTNRGANIQPVLGICYGKTKTSYVRGYMKVVGQNFWYLISENKELYKEIIEPIGFQAEEHNKSFVRQKCGIVNLLASELTTRFSNSVGIIDWPKLVEFNSGNFDLDSFLPE